MFVAKPTCHRFLIGNKTKQKKETNKLTNASKNKQANKTKQSLPVIIQWSILQASSVRLVEAAETIKRYWKYIKEVLKAKWNCSV